MGEIIETILKIGTMAIVRKVDLQDTKDNREVKDQKSIKDIQDQTESRNEAKKDIQILKEVLPWVKLRFSVATTPKRISCMSLSLELKDSILSGMTGTLLLIPLSKFIFFLAEGIKIIMAH